MDLVKIQGLTVHALIGVFEFERHAKQRLILDVDMVTDLELAASTDDVNNTIDYGKVAQRLAELADGSSYFLLEALAKEMLDMIFAEFNPQKVTLTVNKPDILKEAVNVAISMTRERS
ncbi:dihydroneopterin aldolase [Brumicola pallidula]|jgi:dihydroneopterin aldolase|uniref:7,8-dihydroneopterin aldolase n=1 Tax=Brumicola pallidula DSM 14239 = ACAM 615 TaxID=1121922 RepID=K7A3H0_9ALTE|nr:dihydroneopterin aldolase [Glaciecola pallidula]GAC30050.1 dihydroneopterin aldolase [Glaciecola pallidula DSM 14239 = ACAM 615]